MMQNEYLKQTKKTSYIYYVFQFSFLFINMYSSDLPTNIFSDYKNYLIKFFLCGQSSEVLLHITDIAEEFYQHE